MNIARGSSVATSSSNILISLFSTWTGVTSNSSFRSQTLPSVVGGSVGREVGESVDSSALPEHLADFGQSQLLVLAFQCNVGGHFWSFHSPCRHIWYLEQSGVPRSVSEFKHGSESSPDQFKFCCIKVECAATGQFNNQRTCFIDFDFEEIERRRGGYEEERVGAGRHGDQVRVDERTVTDLQFRRNRVQRWPTFDGIAQRHPPGQSKRRETFNGRPVERAQSRPPADRPRFERRAVELGRLAECALQGQVLDRAQQISDQ